MRLRIFNCLLGTCLCLALATPVRAAELQPTFLQQIEQQAHAYLLQVLAEQSPQDILEISINSPDPRLRLTPCDNDLTYDLHGNANNASNVTVKVQCKSGRSWSFYLNASVERLREVAVAVRNIPRGTVLTEADLKTDTRRLSGAGSRTLSNPQAALGMVTRRPLQMGDMVRSSSLTAPTAVRRGDQVRVKAASDDISIVTTGIALSNGKVGEQIRIRNTRSDRIIRARVSAPGLVEVYL